MKKKEGFSLKEAEKVGEKLGLKWDKFSVGEFRRGMDVELEHGTKNPDLNVTNDDSLKTGKIALAHLREFSDYYKRHDKMEKEAEKFWRTKE